MSREMSIISGRSHPDLAKGICKYLNVNPVACHLADFPDGEIDIKIESDIRGTDVYLVQSTCTPVNNHIMELLILMDCVRRASASRITAVIPYFGYARKDRKDEGRVPISAKLVANLITQAGADRVVTVDLHAAQIQGFFDIPVDHLYGSPVLFEHIKKLDLKDLVVVSPDVGGIKRANAYAKRLGAELAIIDKRRTGPEQVEAAHIIGDIDGKNVLLVDDIIATGGSIAEGARILKEHGAGSVTISCTHPVFCGKALERLVEAPVDRVVVTDTIPLSEEAQKIDKIEVLSVAPLLGEAIIRIHENRSVSALFID